VELSTGSALNSDRTLSITQAGQSEIKLTADYETKAFSTPWYYAGRIGRWSRNHAWEVELIHHKIFLTNLNDSIQHFAVSHGYNHLMVNYAWRHWVILRVGAGVIIAHPETEIRNVFSEPGYEWTGPCGQVSVAKRIYFAGGFFGQAEAKFTFARAHFPVNNGSANAPLAALHGVFGLGYEF
jgi:hypothetical protein